MTDDDCLKLTTYLGERDRSDGGFVADALTNIYARHRLQTSLVLRGVEGFGAKHQLRSDRRLTLSEDLPLVSVAVDTSAAIDAALADIRPLRFSGLITIERGRRLTGHMDSVRVPSARDEAVKLTVHLGRQQRVGSMSAYEAVVALLSRRGVAGATVLLGIDGTAYGERRRARFFGRNPQVPVMVVAVGDGERVAAVLPELGRMLARPVVTLERVRVCKRDGEPLARPHRLPDADPSGLGVWQKLIVYAGEQSRHGGQPLSGGLVRALREAGAAGATTLRGVWGYHGAHEPHGDSVWQLRRRVPVMTVIIDTPQRIRDWFSIVDDFTDETGLVTSEIVPAFRVTSPGLERGGLRLAARMS